MILSSLHITLYHPTLPYPDRVTLSLLHIWRYVMNTFSQELTKFSPLLILGRCCLMACIAEDFVASMCTGFGFEGRVTVGGITFPPPSPPPAQQVGLRAKGHLGNIGASKSKLGPAK